MTPSFSLDNQTQARVINGIVLEHRDSPFTSRRSAPNLKHVFFDQFGPTMRRANIAVWIDNLNSVALILAFSHILQVAWGVVAFIPILMVVIKSVRLWAKKSSSYQGMSRYPKRSVENIGFDAGIISFVANFSAQHLAAPTNTPKRARIVTNQSWYGSPLFFHTFNYNWN